jgi:hypothetical protein
MVINRNKNVLMKNPKCGMIIKYITRHIIENNPMLLHIGGSTSMFFFLSALKIKIMANAANMINQNQTYTSALDANILEVPVGKSLVCQYKAPQNNNSTIPYITSRFHRTIPLPPARNPTKFNANLSTLLCLTSAHYFSKIRYEQLNVR